MSLSYIVYFLDGSEWREVAGEFRSREEAEMYGAARFASYEVASCRRF